MTFKLVNGKLFDTNGVEFCKGWNQTFRSTDQALAWLLVLGMSGVMVYE